MHILFRLLGSCSCSHSATCVQVRRGYFLYALCNFTGIGANISSTFTGPSWLGTFFFSFFCWHFKGTVSRDFLLLVFFMNQFPPSPRVFHLDRFEFFRKFAEIFVSQGAPPVSMTPVANFPPFSLALLIPAANLPTVSTTPVAINNTGGKFATGVVDTGGKYWQQYQAAVTLK
jgi:hypothetical protein